MSGGVIAVAWLVSALVFVETIAPRLLAALLAALRKAKAAREAAAKADTPAKAAPAADSPLVGRDVPIAPPSAPLAAPVPVQSSTSPAAVRSPLSSVPTDAADRLWAEARAMPHRYIPDTEKDAEYLTKLYDAAKLGHLEAMAKLGEYAFRRKAFVEAYYWAALADLRGAKDMKTMLGQIKTAWLAAGCPTQRGNSYDRFSNQQGSFARALLRIRAAVEAPVARARMRELADQGCEEARLFLNR